MGTNALKTFVPLLLSVGLMAARLGLIAAPTGSPPPAPVLPLPATTNVAPATAGGAAPTVTGEAPDNTHKLIVGDKLSLKLVEDQEEAKPVMVSDAGELEVPYIGRVPAVGKTCQELARNIKEQLEQKYYHRVTVQLAVDLFNRSQGKVYLAGQVRIPGYQDIPFDEVFTVSKAILRAGGFGDFADKRRVKLTRKKGTAVGEIETIVVDVHEVLEKGKTAKDVRLLPDDTIFIPERGVKF